MRRDPEITEQDWTCTPVAVRTILFSLRQQVSQVEDLKAEISELRERLGKNSHNSSKPPSSDPPFQTKQPRKGLLRRRERKRGPKAGHKGHGRRLKPESEVDHIIELRP